MPTLRAGRGALVAAAGWVALVGACVCSVPLAVAAPASAELQQLVRSATFEVVMRKPEQDPLTYEKPLPFELLPFQQRTDKYSSIGTAFAIGPNTFVSAGHVMQGGVGSQYGIPSLRDGQGNVYPVDRVLKYSLHEDFMVFTVAKPPTVTPLETNPQPSLDQPVYAVGNALGDGVVIRDGLLTSMTPEDQDGRWKWLRFSAAASPGNSGGPLLDATGKVVGVVIARSEGENLNYALPIDRVLNDAGKVASMDVRSSFKLPILTNSDVSTYKDSFPLPQTYPEFAKRILTSRTASYEAEQDRALASHAAELFPKGESAKLLAASDWPERPSLVVQDENRTWEADEGTEDESFDLPDGGNVSVRYQNGVGLFALSRGNRATDEAFYADSRAFMDLLLKSMKVTRPIGPQTIRVTSMGPAAQESTITDRFGRRWQVRTWPIAFFDLELMVFALPTPNGYVGLLRYTSTVEHDKTASELALLADYFQTRYAGTLAQWQAFMKRKGGPGAPFARVKLDVSPVTGVRFASPQFEASVPTSMMNVSATGELTLETQLMPDSSGLTLGFNQLRLNVDDKTDTFIYAKRQQKPADSVGKETLVRWENMLNKRRDFSNTLAHDQSLEVFWVRSVTGIKAAGSEEFARDTGVLYEIGFQTDQKILPRELEARRTELAKTFRILER